MARFCTFFSSSSGNASCVVCGDTAVLFDCGKSAKTVMTRMREAEIPADRVRAICITHEHSDHISALTVLSGKLQCPIYAPPKVAAYIEANCAPRSEVRVIESGSLAVGDLSITPFETPHDSLQSVGYLVHTADERTIGIATDLGHLTPEIEQRLLGCDLVLLESNYDARMLQLSSYPYPLRQRIGGPNGHLCNDDCAGFLPRLVESGTTRLVLGHLSRENNTYERALATAQAALAKAGMSADSDYRLAVADRDNLGKIWML